jgi:hypothetical protein
MLKAKMFNLGMLVVCFGLLSACKKGQFSNLKTNSAASAPQSSNMAHGGNFANRKMGIGKRVASRSPASPDSDWFKGAKSSKGKSMCHAPRTSNGFGVDTDGGAKNGSKTHQAQQSYQNTFGSTLNPAKVLGAVNTRQDGLTGGDIICYKNNANGKKVCGVVFDNAYTRSQKVARSTKTGKLKPEEATAPVHRALGATYASGAGTSLSKTKITAQPVKLSSEDRKDIIRAMKEARRSGDYKKANQLIQEKARGSGCVSPQMMG